MIVWPSGLCRHLADTYAYDPVGGFILRRSPSSFGPRQAGPLGTLMPNGSMMISVKWEGKSWNIQLHRLAVYLSSRKQYKTIRFNDGVKSNIKYTNLVAYEELLESATVPEHIAAERARVRQEYINKKEEAKRLFQEERLKPRLSSKVDPEYLRQNPLGYPEPDHSLKPVVKKKWQAEYDRLMTGWKEMRFKRGLYSGKGVNNWRAFLMESAQHSIFKTVHDIPQEVKEMEGQVYEDLPKWERDRALCLLLEKQFNSGRETEAGIETRFEYYRWQEERVEGSYDKLPKLLQDRVDQVRAEEEAAEPNGAAAPTSEPSVEPQTNPAQPTATNQ